MNEAMAVVPNINGSMERQRKETKEEEERGVMRDVFLLIFLAMLDVLDASWG